MMSNVTLNLEYEVFHVRKSSGVTITGGGYSIEESLQDISDDRKRKEGRGNDTGRDNSEGTNFGTL